MRLGIAETLEKIAKLPKKERVNELRKNDNFTMRTILQGAFDPRVVWQLPSGAPPFKKNMLPDLEGVLYADSKKLYLFVEGGHPTLKQNRRESLYIAFLENLAPADADLMCAVKDKKIPYKAITADLVREAFPGLIPDEQEQAKVA